MKKSGDDSKKVGSSGPSLFHPVNLEAALETTSLFIQSRDNLLKKE